MERGEPARPVQAAAARIERATGWRVDVEVVQPLLRAVHGDLDGVDAVARGVADQTELLARPFRPLDALAPACARAPAGAPGDAVVVALLHAIGAEDPLALRAALEDLDGSDAACTAALDAGLLRRVPGGVAPADPAVAARTWVDATDEQRTRALAALASRTPDPEARAWYDAWAATGPDAGCAQALVAAGERALGGGRAVRAGSAYEVAAALHPDPGAADALAVRAAEVFFVAGLLRHALALLRRRADETRDPATLATVHRMVGRVLLFEGELADAEAHLLAHAGPVAARHADLGLLLRAEALWVRAVDGRLATALPLIAEGGPPDDDSPRFVKACWTGLRNMLGTGVERTELEERAAEFRAMPADDPEATMVGYVILHAAMLMDARDIADEVLEVLRHRQVREGAAANRALVLAGASELAWWRGDWALARSSAQEALDLASLRGDTISPARAVLTLARCFYAGDGAAAADELLERYLPSVPGWSHPALLAARGHGHLVRGRTDQAVAELRAAIEAETQPESGLPHAKMSAAGGDHVTALVLAGRLDEAASFLDRWRSDPGASGRWAQGAARRCDALLLEGEEADDATAEAVALLQDFPLEQGRALLEQGWRQLHGHDAEAALSSFRAALRRFVGLGATAWARQAEAGLADPAISDDGVRHALGRLSPQERQLVGLVAEGLTNREVATALHLSPKTVENRLTGIYAALGVRSRVDLVRRVGEGRGGPLRNQGDIPLPGRSATP
ncbi:LuxR C-terminal-related transcriptional regulator [Iamia majanohamensis]|uniref:LuxR C-terminal-related transcriptional regulator n=1 Tax=Iamia majanohamensis TaxID=467976 RepID=A0AAE9YGT4_9ACTN|nr:LuxR family transcriptional regulator [Iamia majanohamensis]WCO67511.1 LuxR C-terminal-related transcriptional regulator [Iamia majanohamensis]